MIDPRPQHLLLALALAALSPEPASPGVQGGASLSSTTDVGRVLDREGGALRRAALSERWSPVEAGTALEPGDWLEVASRGANALRVRLAGGGELVLGPGTLVLVAAGNRLSLTRGEVEVRPAPGATLEVAGPQGGGRASPSLSVEARSVLRARDGVLEVLDLDPRWLTGYRSNASTEALGSLLANVDGRNVPLTIGYHKVTVDVRDQIARTVVEESFVNHTSSVLEGVFYFPLPADASISGFGMWIGDELVQGEIVEKERAREIYETILRERRDPGLLEWTGGNVFKARIFPIGAEKRVRIAYTQVLPKVGDTFAYRYALESELLRVTPLARLEIAVHLSSAEPLASVTSPSHACRIRATEHAAEVEFTAEEFAPDGDFELFVTTAPRSEALTLVPHLRAGEGYFMLLVNGPIAVPGELESAPIELLVLADTSGSMWGTPRANQIAFVEALVAALSPRDTFDLATVDVETRWAFGEGRVNDIESRERALDFLEERDPLGWTDLAAAFTAACERAGPRTHVVYVGDGVPTSGSADPNELAGELARAWRGQGTFHAVQPGSSSEMAVLRALARLGGGSLRAIGGGADAAQAAFALLAEIASPPVVDLRVDFSGLPVAAVYPEVLPNLPAGGQQIVLGRYDPSAGSLAGRVRVTGTHDGQPVELASDVVLPSAQGEAGNSFVPRLWARGRLDLLLEQGRSSAVRERIVALSEDFQIATPYTSFLVLESDLDRERFGVKTRFRLRDGEEFFAQGRADARHELVREQMNAARGWRRELRARVLEGLAGMGRDLTNLLRSPMPLYDESGLALALGATAGGRYDEVDGFAAKNGALRELAPSPAAAPEETNDDAGEPDLDLDAPPESEDQAAQDTAPSAAEREAKTVRQSRDGLLDANFVRWEAVSEMRGRVGSFGAKERYDARGMWFPVDPFDALFPSVAPPRAADPIWTWPSEVVELLARVDRRAALARSEHSWRIDVQHEWSDPRGSTRASAGTHLVGPQRWVTLAPHVAGNVYAIDWCDGERRGLLMEGWRLGRTRGAADGDASSWSEPFAWYFGDSLRGFAGHAARLVDDAVGVVRVEFTAPWDPKSTFELGIDVERGLVLDETYVHDGVRKSGVVFEGFREAGGLWWPSAQRSWSEGDGEARTPRFTSSVRIDVATLAPDEFARQVQLELVRRDDALLLRQTALAESLPRRDRALDPRAVAEAKQAVRDGRAGIDEHWLLLRHFARTARFERATPHLDAIAELAPSARGLARIRLVFLRESRRNEELARELERLAAELAGAPRDAELGLAHDLLSETHALNQGDELLAFLATLEAVFRRQTAEPDAALAWDRAALAALAQVNRPEELFEAQRAAARAWPFALDLQASFAQALAQRGEVDAALAHLASVEEESGLWQPYELTQLRHAAVDCLWNAYRLDELLVAFEAWEREAPELLDSGLCGRRLVALVFLDRERDAQALVDAWIAFAAQDERSAADEARLQAAVQFSLGQGGWLYRQRIEDADAERLARAARALLDDDDDWIASSILSLWQFRRTDAAHALVREVFRAIDAGVEELPARRLAKWVGLVHGSQWSYGDAASLETDAPAWRAVFERVLARWVAARGGDPLEREPLAQILRAHADPDLRARFLRLALEEAEDGAGRSPSALELFRELSSRPWSAEVERELAALLAAARLGDDATPDELFANLDARVLLLHDFVDWILSAGTDAIVAALPDFETLPRRTLAAERAKALRTARAGALEVVARLETSLEPRELAEWATIERAFLRVSSGVQLEEAWSDALALLARATERIAAAAEPHDVGDVTQIALRDRILAERAIRTAARLLLTTDDEALESRLSELLAALDRIAALDSDLPDGRASTRDVLIALDRVAELERALASWFGGGADFTTMRFGRDLAHVLAERGELAKAARVLEAIDEEDELAPADLSSLSAWYNALDRADDARRAKLAALEVMTEDELASRLHSIAVEQQRSGEGVPPELDADVPGLLVALLRKARDPGNHFWVLHELYAATADFRLLECLPEAVLGQTAQRIYPLLAHIGQLAVLVHEEAVVDRIDAHVERLRSTAATDVDRRALALIRFQIALRAARQTHGTRDHAATSLAALRAAFDGAWERGELGLMAGFLADQGRLEPDALAEEQIEELRALHQLATAQDERLAIAERRATTLWNYERRDEAVLVLEAALNERRSASAGVLSQSANEARATLSQWFVSMGSFRRAEALWTSELAAARPASERLWVAEQLFGVQRDAVLARAELALGRGDDLYARVVAALERELEVRTNENHAAHVAGTLLDLLRRAGLERIVERERAARDAADFAFGLLPRALALYQHRGAQNLVGMAADCLYALRGARTALEFLVTRAEGEPAWLRLAGQDFWPHQGWRFCNYAHEAGAPGGGLEGALDERALAIVLRELRRDLGARESRNRSTYDQRHGSFWTRHRGVFLREALAFVEEQRESPWAVAYAAEYLFHGLSAHAEAIDALASAHAREILHLEGRDQLATYLQHVARWEESIAVVEGLVADRPLDARYRVMRMRAHAALGDRITAAHVLTQAESAFRAAHGWFEHAIAVLAAGAVECELHDDAVRLFGEAIALHVRSAPNRGVGDGVLSTYYRQQSAALAGLGRTAEAVDAAAGAIVSWGSNVGERARELESLVAVLAAAEDLGGFVAELDREVAASGLENPIVRQALGRVYLRRGEHERAVRELSLALAARPDDLETHALLLEVYDAMGRRDLAARALLERARAAGHELEPWVDLGRRFAALEDPERAERAFTTLVELSPNESEGHALFASLREEAGRFDDAAVHWRHVVRIRTNDPTGHLGLARALIQAERFGEARSVLEHVLSTTWPEHFGDQRAVARTLLAELGARG